MNDRRIARAGLFAAALAVLMAGPAAAQSGGVSLALGTQGPGAELEDLDGNAVALIPSSVGRAPVPPELNIRICELRNTSPSAGCAST